ALLCRATNVLVFLPFFIYLLARVARAGMVGCLARQVPVVLVGMAPFLVQMLIWQGLYGRPFLYSYEGGGFHWLRPALWQTLLSSRHGLLLWSPLLLAAIAGFVWQLRRPQPLLLCFVASFLLLRYCNSAWHCWWFGHA